METKLSPAASTSAMITSPTPATGTRLCVSAAYCMPAMTISACARRGVRSFNTLPVRPRLHIQYIALNLSDGGIAILRAVRCSPRQVRWLQVAGQIVHQYIRTSQFRIANNAYARLVQLVDSQKVPKFAPLHPDVCSTHRTVAGWLPGSAVHMRHQPKPYQGLTALMQ